MTKSPGPPVVVGVDPRGFSIDAVRWATHEAVTNRAPLHLVHAAAWSSTSHIESTSAPDPVLASAVSRVRSDHPALPVTMGRVHGAAATALLHASAAARLVVLGADPYGAVRLERGLAVCFSSLVRRVPMGAACPVVVVPPGSLDSSSSLGTVVVGVGVDVDGSTGDESALAFAAARAAKASMGLRIVRLIGGSHPPGSGHLPPHGAARPANPPIDRGAFERAADLARRWCPDVEVVDDQVDEDPVEALARQARYAALVVVGSRGWDATSRYLLGAVTTRLVGESARPVAVVPS